MLDIECMADWRKREGAACAGLIESRGRRQVRPEERIGRVGTLDDQMGEQGRRTCDIRNVRELPVSVF